MKKGLTQQEATFANHYMLTRNGRQSAILAGYSESNASQCGSRLLRRQRIIDEIKRLETSMLSETNVTRPMMEAFYVKLMRDKSSTIDQQLKAGDLLCKLMGFYRRDLDLLLGMDETELAQRIQRTREGLTIEAEHKLIPHGK